MKAARTRSPRARGPLVLVVPPDPAGHDADEALLAVNLAEAMARCRSGRAGAESR